MAVVREMSVAYDGQAIPGTIAGASLHLTGIHRILKGFDTAEVVFRFVVQSATETIHAAACLAVEALFSAKGGDLDIELLANNSLSFSEAANTGFDITPLISKPGETDPRFDTNTSRLYEVSVSAGVPALVAGDSPAGTDGIREFGYDVSYTSARRGGIVVRGVATATPAPSLATATANIASIVPGRVATIAAAFGWTVEIVSQRDTPNEGDTEANFEHAYRQVIFDQESGTLNSTLIIDPVMSIRVGVPGTTDDPKASPLRTVVCDYTAAIDSTQSRTMIDVFNNVILPYVLSTMRSTVGGSMALTLVEPAYNNDENTLTARFEGVSSASGTLLSRRIEYLDEFDSGKVIRYIWPDADESDSDPTPAYVYQANKVIKRTVKTTTENIGEPAPQQVSGSSGGGFFGIQSGSGVGGGGSGFFGLRGSSGGGTSSLEVAQPIEGAAILRRRNTTTSKKFVGLSGSRLKISTRETVEVFEIVRLIGG